jgi:Flp pilus assembly protein TadD
MPTAPDLLTQSRQASAQGHDALALLHQAATQPDATAEVLFALGSEHVERGDEAEGQACFERALALNPGWPIARLQHGSLQ